MSGQESNSREWVTADGMKVTTTFGPQQLSKVIVLGGGDELVVSLIEDEQPSLIDPAAPRGPGMIVIQHSAWAEEVGFWADAGPAVAGAIRDLVHDPDRLTPCRCGEHGEDGGQ